MAIVLQTLSDSKQAQADLARLRESVDGIKASADKTTSSLGNFTKIFAAGIAAVGGFSVFTKYSDTLTNINTKLKIATTSQEEFNYAFEKVKTIALTTRSNLSAVSTLYSKTAANAKMLGVNQAQVAKFTELVSKSTAASGATAQEAAAGIQQLGQALASNNFAGDELRSILENVPFLAQRIAEGLHVSVGELRKMGEEGKLVGSQVFGAILSQQGKINDAFSKVGITYGAAYTNLGNSLVLLFGAVKSSITDSTSSMADWINSIALKIGFIATNFKYSMFKAEAFVADFVIAALDMFDALKEKLTEVAKTITETAKELYVKWKPALDSILVEVKAWAGVISVLMISAYSSFLTYVSSTALGKAIASGFSKSVDVVVKLGSKLRDSFKNLFPTIDVNKFFPNLEQVKGYVANFAKTVEGWFFWIYDRVIGHSWIPDLVNGVIFWTKKLLGAPLKFISQFSTSANGIFKSLSLTTVFTGSLIVLSKYKSMLFTILGIVGSIAAAWGAMSFLKNAKVPQKPTVKNLSEITDKNKTNTYLKDTAKWTKEMAKTVKKNFDTSTFGHTVKQILGMKDTTPGNVGGTNIDTNSTVGRGPQRYQEDPGIIHNLVNALPKDWQVPVVAGLGGAVVLALVTALEASPFRNAMIGIATTIFGVIAARNIDSKTINNAMYSAGDSFMKAVSWGMEKLFGGNIMKDPFGGLALIAKLSLLFKSGREYLGKAALGAITAPTKVGLAAGDQIERLLNERKLKQLDRTISSLPRNLQEAVNKNAFAYNKEFLKLTNMNDKFGRNITAQMATNAIAAKDYKAFGSRETELQLKKAIKANTGFQEATGNQGNATSIKKELEDAKTGLSALNTKLKDRIAESRAALVQGFKNTTAGAGGIVGGVAGFQIGEEIAKSMSENTPAWQKVGVVMATSFIGQGIGASFGLMAGAAISAVLGLAWKSLAWTLTTTLALTNPWIAGAVIIGAALYAGYKLFESLPEIWKTKMVDAITPDSRREGGRSYYSNNGAKAERENGANTQAKHPITGEQTTMFTEKGVNYFWDKGVEKYLNYDKRNDISGLTANESVVSTNLPQMYTVSAETKRMADHILSLTTYLKANFGIVAKTANQNSPSSYNESNKTLQTRDILSSDFPARDYASALHEIGHAIDGINGNLDKNPNGVNRNKEELSANLFATQASILDKNNKDFAAMIALSTRSYGNKNIPEGSLKSFKDLADNGIIDNSTGKVLIDISKQTVGLLQGLSKENFKRLTGSRNDIAKPEDQNMWIKVSGFLKEGKNWMTKALSDSGIAPTTQQGTSVPNYSEPRVEKTLLDSMKTQKSMDGSLNLMANAFNKAGYKDINASKLKSLSIDNTNIIADMLHELRKYQTIAAKSRPGSYQRKFADHEVARAKDVLNDQLRTAANAQQFDNQIASKLPESASGAGKGTETITLATEFDTITKTLPGLELSIEEFRKMSDSLRESIYDKALEIYNADTKINNTPIGTSFKQTKTVGDKAVIGSTTDVKASDAWQKIDADRKAATEQFRSKLDTVRTPYAMNATELSGLGIQEGLYNLMSDTQVNLLTALRESVKASTEILKKPTSDTSVTTAMRTDAQIAISDKMTAINKLVEEASLNGLKQFESLQKGLSGFGISIDRATYNMIDGTNRDLLESYLKALKDAAAQREASTSPEMDKAAQVMINKIGENAGKLIAKHGKDYKTKATMAGESFASSVSDGVYNGISGYFKGEISGKSLLKSVVDTFTKGIIDTFIKGIMDPLTGENGFINTMLKDFGSKLFSTGSLVTKTASGGQVATTTKDPSEPIVDVITATTEQSVQAQGSFFSELGLKIETGTKTLWQGLLQLGQSFMGLFGGSGGASSSFSGILGSLGSSFSGMFDGMGSSIGSWIGESFSMTGASGWLSGLFMADGGHISGPGTGRSDSIPIWGSNGEFMINADATKKNRRLLEAINSGKMPAFADGGIIGVQSNFTAVDNAATKAEAINAKKSQSVQHFNINVTGDVSRQTRKEIQQMIPQIATGVNSHNREIGFNR